MTPTRYLCVDLGDKRTGLAVGDSVVRLASPAGLIQTPIGERDGEALLEKIARAALEHLGPPSAAGVIVVGLPVNMDGTEGPRSRLAREFGARIAARTGREVAFADERLSTAAADWTLAQSGLTYKQKKLRRDAVAAAGILTGFLDRLGSA